METGALRDDGCFPEMARSSMLHRSRYWKKLQDTEFERLDGVPMLVSLLRRPRPPLVELKVNVGRLAREDYRVNFPGLCAVLRLTVGLPDAGQRIWPSLIQPTDRHGGSGCQMQRWSRSRSFAARGTRPHTEFECWEKGVGYRYTYYICRFL